MDLQESRQILRSLILGLMDLHNSKEFRQAGITDQLVYGRKLRSWQVLSRLRIPSCNSTGPAHYSRQGSLSFVLIGPQLVYSSLV